MARTAKKEKKLTPEEKLAQALVPDVEQPYRLPENWCWTNLRTIADILNGFAFKSANYVDSGIRIIRIANVQDGYVEDDAPVYYPVDSQQEIKRFLLQENDLLISLTGNVGRVALLPLSFLPAALNQRVACLRITSECLIKKYLFYSLLRDSFQKECIKNSKGSAQLNMGTEWLKEQAFPLAPFAEQQRIVDRIESLFAKLDEAKEKAQTVVDGFEDRKSAILHKAFTGELTESWRRSLGYSKSTWEHKRFSDFCDIVRGGSPRPAGDPKYYDGNIPFMKVADITNNRGPYVTATTYTIKEAGLKKTRMVGANTLLLTNSGATLGVPAICTFQTTFNDGIAAFLNLNSDSLLFFYYFWTSKTQELRAINMGAAQPNLNTNIIGAVEIDLPPDEERQEIANRLDDLLTREQEAKEAAEQVIDQIDAIKKSILARAFHGELGTNDPADESAVELLKRVL